jgi:small subunit ribosomal protein S5
MEKPDFKKDGTKFNKKKQPPKLSKLKYNERIVQVKRVTKVVKGGKKMTFRAVVIIGDTRQKVGVGVGRADDVNLAIDKAILNAKKNLIVLPLTTNSSIPHVVQVKYGSCSVMLRPAAEGTGVIAGGAMRTVLELGGARNILGKQLGSDNILNNAKATILALTTLNEKIELGKYQSIRRQAFYDKVMKKYKNAQFSK